ncbi:leucine-rich repeat domain-containing protein [Ruminococcus albus]|uniref:Leucine rich repeat-containing protein n=1 Tax=Ruminococcus albus TaxID=1264 RepID=A0A1H7JGI8_RUMAL|nr:leucine-rich repeat domain-containing protein [Ruminococcus albus]SEK73709.1 Leucine rich repeat-containing protein [Ruminococcus albus]
MNNKKMVAGLLALTFVFGGTFLPGAANNSTVISASAETIAFDDYEYRLLEDGTAEIARYRGEDTEVTIPDKIDGVAVTSIGESAFEGNFDITGVIMPDSVTTIKGYAFTSCFNLKSIKFSKNLKSIGETNFAECVALDNVVIPDGVERIEVGTFNSCTNLKNIVLPQNLKYIGEAAFGYCTDLNNVTIPASVTEIGEEAFSEYDTHDDSYKPLKNVIINCYANSAAEKYAKANSLNYKLIDEKLPNCPPTNMLRAECSAEYHQIRFSWDPIGGAEKYGIAVYLSGKWRVWTSSIPATTTTFTTPKNLTPGRTYKVAVAARVNGKWNTTDPIKNAVTVTVK